MESTEQALLNEVTEQLNQLLIKLDKVGGIPFSDIEDYNGRNRLGKTPEPILNEDGEVDEDAMADAEPIIDAEVKLACIKEAIKVILSESKWSGGPANLMEKYYDSSCY